MSNESFGATGRRLIKAQLCSGTGTVTDARGKSSGAMSDQLTRCIPSAINTSRPEHQGKEVSHQQRVRPIRWMAPPPRICPNPVVNQCHMSAPPKTTYDDSCHFLDEVVAEEPDEDRWRTRAANQASHHRFLSGRQWLIDAHQFNIQRRHCNGKYNKNQ